MANKTIKHFILTRFFPQQNPNYSYDILDVDFLKKQLPLTKNILRTLENQTNKNFEVIFLVNNKFLDNPKYEFIFSTLKDSTNLPLKITNIRSAVPFIKDAYDNYDFVIQTKMDFDDFVYKDAVAETQNKVNECDSLLLYGYNVGYQYIYGELYPFTYYGSEKNGHHSIFQSLILESSFAKKFPLCLIWNLRHGLIKIDMKDHLEKNGIEFLESMFQLQQNTSVNAFIYFRHEFSLDQLSKHDGNPQIRIPKAKPLTTADITKTQLKSEFGFTYDLKSIKDEERSFDYYFKSIQAAEFGFRQDLNSIKWVE